MLLSKEAAFLKLQEKLFRNKKEVEGCKKDLRSKLEEIDKAIDKQRETLRELQTANHELDNQDAQALYEKTVKSNLEKRAEIDRLKEKKTALESDNAINENILSKYQEYRNLLLKMLPPWWQEAQEVKTLKAKNPQNEQNSESEEEAISKGVENGLKLSPDRELPLEPMMPSSQDDTLVASANLFSDDAESKELREIYSDPSQVLTAMSNLLSDIDFLLQNSTTDQTMMKAIMEQRQNMEEDEEELTLQANELVAKIEEKKEIVEWCRKKVEYHQPDNGLTEALNKMATNVYSLCGNKSLTNLSLTEKIKAVDSHMFNLLNQTRKIPAVQLKELRQKMYNERRKREQMERLRLEKEKHQEKMEMHKKRAMEKSLKTTGRKLMPRSNPDDKKVEAVSEPAEPAEEDSFSSFDFK